MVRVRILPPAPPTDTEAAPASAAVLTLPRDGGFSSPLSGLWPMGAAQADAQFLPRCPTHVLVDSRRQQWRAE